MARPMGTIQDDQELSSAEGAWVAQALGLDSRSLMSS